MNDKIKNTFKIPFDGHLIKNMYLKYELEYSNSKKINEWNSLEIFDNPNFLNYNINDTLRKNNLFNEILIEPITTNLKNYIYEDLKNKISDQLQLDILDYFHGIDNNDTNENVNEKIIFRYIECILILGLGIVSVLDLQVSLNV
mgnify:CR=1 FL=1